LTNSNPATDSPLFVSTDKDLKSIKKQMIKIINKDYPLRREEVTREEARTRIEALNEPYKLEILDAIKTEPITIYHIGDEWWDLCAGPHVESTKKIHPKAIDLESVAGAYWRGDEKRPMLQRIYGTAWGSPEELKAYNEFKAEAARRDHRKIGKDLNLFSIQQEEVGGGLVFWHPKGAIMRDMIERFWKDIHLERGYDLLYTPHVGKADLWKTSGHSDFYAENMYKPIDVEDETYQLKPMNCPFHVAVYKDGYFSYRDLPIRWAELGTVYRYERSGTMHGLFRVRGFTQDDAHIFCLPHQIADEIKGVLDLTEDILSTFGFTEFEVNLSTQPEKSVGGPEIWDKAEGALKDALAQKGWDYEVDEGGGAFYGPKIDIKILDAIGRKWQCSTVQLDFNLPERFDLAYIDKENAKQRPIMIHRAIFGSLERFFGILTENYAGAFPLWVAPTQVRLLPVTDAVDDYVQETARKLRAAGIRCDVQSQERLAKLVRNAEKAKIPVMCVVGEQEAKDGTLAVRTYADGDQGVLSVDDVLSRVSAANAGKLEKF
jgi:threonyl-tRNA synthetase